MIFRARQFQFTFPRPALIMGIVNVTPDSFSDGGRYASPDAAVAHGLALAEEGADILDVGGESSRPGSDPVPESEELRRAIPVVKALAARLSIPVSIDTTKPAVARAALDAGAAIVNDVFSGTRLDSAIWELVAAAGAGYILMHIQGAPKTMQVNPHYNDVVAEVNELFSARLNRLAGSAVKSEQIALDPGIGFGKTLEHNLQLLGGWRHFRQWKRPLVLGASRKSFMTRVVDADTDERLAPSLACACWAVSQGVEIIRCHDVRQTRQAARMIEAIRR